MPADRAPLRWPAGRARLPAVLTLALGALAAGQLALPVAAPLPPAGAVAAVAPRRSLPRPDAVAAPAILTARPLFAPVVQAAAAGPTDPLGGAVIAGTVSRGAVTLALVQMPGGAIRTLSPGGTIAGWRIAALAPGGARLVRGGRALFVAYGAHAAAPAATSGT